MLCMSPRHLPQLLCRHLFTTTIPPNSRTPTHHDAPSFLRYARDTALSPTTTVYVGTLYEYTVLRSLSRLGMTLSRTGGKSDRGLDLCGTWSPPTPAGLPSRNLTVYVQCKAERKNTGPKYLRELEGTLGLSRSADSLGILASASPCTPGTRQHMLLSKKPLAYCSVAPYDQGGYLMQFLWNSVAGRLIGRAVGVTTKYVTDIEDVREEAVLTLDGQAVVQDNNSDTT